jgi:hypothetical protein
MVADLPAFQWIGVGRDGGSRGEFMAVFYRTARLEPLAFDPKLLRKSDITSMSWSRQPPASLLQFISDAFIVQKLAPRPDELLTQSQKLSPRGRLRLPFGSRQAAQLLGNG